MKFKKELRRMNRYIRQMNDNIKNDDLWRGRFYARQVEVQRATYLDDHYSLHCVFVYEFIDLKTGKKKRYVYENFFHGVSWKIFRDMNDFIVEECRVWDEPDIRTDKTVWRTR